MTMYSLPALFNPPPADSPVAKVPLSNPSPPIHLSLFRNVTNTSEIRKRIISGDKTVPECALINAATILEVFQIQMACTKALLLQQQNAMRTRSLYSEILFNLSPSSNINDSLKQFGVSDSSTSLLVVMLGPEPSNEVKSRVSSLIAGEQVGLEVLPTLTDLPLVSKIYKAANGPKGSLERGQLLAIVVGAMALKGHT
ncbi:hypothetical protein HK097_000203 [Rhizophlyctis rosea]|uniref:EKC/KEOPS complex subunit CGI121 n=1 Tax=Rhizophlyctis rosea TaxID=64517 RepID=A0AAD5S8E1_9FUNG|nr:hypothetical protein HK097_000203 [Rhizophlyctis rosea]